MSRMQRVLLGMRAMPIGVRALFGTKKFFALYLLPFLASLIVVLSLVILNSKWIWSHADSYMPAAWAGHAWGTAIFAITVILVLCLNVIFSVLFGFVILNVIAIPIHTLMCEKYMKENFQFQPVAQPLGKRILTSLYFLGIGIAKSFILLVLGFLCFAGAFIPGLSLFFAFFAFLLLAYDCSDVVFEIKEWKLSYRTQFFRKNIWEFSGFAIAIGLTFFIPLLNFILLPGFILGSAYLVESLEKRTHV